MSSGRGKSPGWAALSLQNKQKQVLDPKVPAEPFPALLNSTTLTPLRSSKPVATNNNISAARPFSAAISPSVDFAVFGNNSLNITSEVGTSSGQHNTRVPEDRNKLDHISEKLKGLYNLADDSLIEDILEAVNDDYEKASASLEAMLSGEGLKEYKDTQADYTKVHDDRNKLDCISEKFKGLYSWADDSLMEDILEAFNDDYEKASAYLEAIVSGKGLKEYEYSEADATKVYDDRNKLDHISKRFKGLYSWADDSLIEDILEAFNNDCEKASAYLEAIVSGKGLKEYEYPQADNTKVPDGRNKLDHISRKLKGLYSWADDSLIEDILEAVNDDYEKASASLEAIVSGKGLKEYEDRQADNTEVPNNRNKFDHISKKLKGLYSWADDSLIEDILEAVNDDYEKASASLKAMVSGKGLKEYKDTRADNSSYLSKDSCLDGNSSSFPGACFSESNRQLMNEPGKFDNDEEMKLILSQFAHILIEPEREDDSIYMSRRKEALKMMREASRHSKAASNAFMRGDHLSARLYSQQARSERAAAEKLNEKASHEILSLHNSENGMWKLDLHGLHAKEAVLAVQMRLREIESLVSLNGSLLPDSVGGKKDAANLSSGFNDMKKRDEQASCKQTPMVLEVITGVGKHSRGAAALPGAVRSFLVENRYRFDEARPGVISVRPKFRGC